MRNKDEIISDKKWQDMCGADITIWTVRKKDVEKIMQRIHSIQYNPLNVVARNADLVLQASVKNEPNNEIREMIVNEIAHFTEFLQIDHPPKNTIKTGVLKNERNQTIRH